MPNSAIVSRVKKAVAQELFIDVQNVGVDKSLMSLTNASSLDILMLQLALEDEFDIPVKDGEITQETKVSEIVTLVMNKLEITVIN